MPQLEPLRDQPEKGAHLDRGHELKNFGTWFAKQQIGEAGAVSADDKVRALEEQDLFPDTHTLKEDGFEALVGEKRLHLIKVLDLAGRAFSFDQQAPISRAARAGILCRDPLLKALEAVRGICSMRSLSTQIAS